jgi:hypothetical protein
LVEYEWFWPTIPEIQSDCFGYPRLDTLYKRANGVLSDYSNISINQHVAKIILTWNRVKIVGINKSYCVKDTVRDLQNLWNKEKSKSQLMVPPNTTLNICDQFSKRLLQKNNPHLITDG